ncbi:hypothetical protein NEOLEDRAFT_1046589, partial [Neolentinus lepideus HHB14362 ss-1]
SLTAVLPVTTTSLPQLQVLLRQMFSSHSRLKEAILVTPDELVREARKVLWELTSTLHGRDYPNISIHPVKNGSSTVYNILDTASEASTDWLLILDEHGLRGVDSQTKDMLLNPKAVSLPYGPNGQAYRANNLSCVETPWSLQPAAFVVPPMVLPATILFSGSEDSNRAPTFRTWEEMGYRISHSQLDLVGGLVFGSAQSDRCFSPGDQLVVLPDPVVKEDQVQASGNPGRFLVILHAINDLQSFSVVLCRLQEKSYTVKVILRQAFYPSDGQTQSVFACDLAYDNLPVSSSEVSAQLSETLFSFQPNVVIDTSDDAALTNALRVILEGDLELRQPTVIHLPKDDLPYSDWMGALSLQEWKHWNIPRVDVSVITNDRPTSLGRLLRSLQRAQYFGDSLDLRINMDSAADSEVKRLVSRYRWPHGSTFVHHRIIHGGLLPAVVESWYPLHNDSFGLILEDDVELSPLFYAWAKMAILHVYRYGNDDTDTSRLFGISLYQQKTIELRPEGRRPFNARSLFLREGLQHINTPYLSQIPCSWGAIYFPEHWREFHDYLSIRLSELRLPISDDVVPALRSNNWTKSWKKYFIELSYLRGYVMLYPNYDNFTSLSTNHLEIGSHVKDTPKELYEQKKRLFHLPLLTLPYHDDSPVSTGILELPGRTLPPWSTLPILDHQGSITSLNDIVDKGSIQRSHVFSCSQPTSVVYDARDLTCV